MGEVAKETREIERRDNKLKIDKQITNKRIETRLTDRRAAALT